MSKIKWLKFVLASALLLVACACFALADGDPVIATLNGQPYYSLPSAVAASQPGDHLVVVHSTSLSTQLVFKAGTYVTIPAGVTVSSSASFNNSAYLTVYGDLVRTGTDGNTNFLSCTGGTTDLYGNVVDSEVRGSAVGIPTSTTSSPVVNIWRGRYIGSSTAIATTGGSGSITIFGGQFLPSLSVSGVVKLAPGVSFVDNSSSVVSWGPLSSISSFVVESLQWISLFCALIVTNKLLLIFLLVVFTALGLGLMKRVVR